MYQNTHTHTHIPIWDKRKHKRDYYVLTIKLLYSYGGWPWNSSSGFPVTTVTSLLRLLTVIYDVISNNRLGTHSTIFTVIRSINIWPRELERNLLADFSSRENILVGKDAYVNITVSGHSRHAECTFKVDQTSWEFRPKVKFFSIVD